MSIFLDYTTILLIVNSFCLRILILTLILLRFEAELWECMFSKPGFGTRIKAILIPWRRYDPYSLFFQELQITYGKSPGKMEPGFAGLAGLLWVDLRGELNSNPEPVLRDAKDSAAGCSPAVFPFHQSGSESRTIYCLLLRILPVKYRMKRGCDCYKTLGTTSK
jgi:hypothetical protein